MCALNRGDATLGAVPATECWQLSADCADSSEPRPNAPARLIVPAPKSSPVRHTHPASPGHVPESLRGEVPGVTVLSPRADEPGGLRRRARAPVLELTLDV